MLTAKQMKFADFVSEGNSQSNAYREAYDSSQMSSKTIWEAASRLRRHPKVAARISTLEAEKMAIQRMQLRTREERIIQKLENIAFGDGNIRLRLKALEMLGKSVGLFKP